MSKGKPYRPFFVGKDWELIFRLPAPAMKIWMYHYSLEGRNRRESWPSVETLMQKCDMSRDSVFTHRKWLVEHGWLVQCGFVASQHGHFSVPKYRCEKGTVSEKTVDGRGKNRLGKLPTRSHREKSDTDASEKIRPEVMPHTNLSNASAEPMTPMKEGKKEGNPPLASLATDVRTVPSEKKNPESGVAPANQNQKAWGDEDLMAVWLAWLKLVPLSEWSDNDRQAARHVADEYGADAVESYLLDTALCPKTLKVIWSDFTYWASSIRPKGLTKRNIDAWRRAKDAKEVRDCARATEKALRGVTLAAPPRGLTSSACSNCKVNEIFEYGPYCRPCLDTFNMEPEPDEVGVGFAIED
jgi:hypothetical protein